MCCALLALVLVGPRFFGAIWWLFEPLRWQSAFTQVFSGGLWWLWPILGLIFLPWTTITFVLVAPLGVVGLDLAVAGPRPGGGHFLVRRRRRP